MNGWTYNYGEEYDERAQTSILGEPSRLMMCLTHDELCNMQTAIVVETWEHFVGRDAAGSKRRKYHAEFDEKERKLAGKLHTRFYRWHLVTGVPQKVVMSARTISFVERLVAFAATV